MYAPGPATRPVDVDGLVRRQQELRSLCAEALDLQRRMASLRARILARRGELRAARRKLRDDLCERRSALQTDASQAGVMILEAAARAGGIAGHELWLDYFALGGEATPDELEEILSGERPLYRLDHDRLVIAINEQLRARGGVRPLAFWDGTR